MMERTPPSQTRPSTRFFKLIERWGWGWAGGKRMLIACGRKSMALYIKTMSPPTPSIHQILLTLYTRSSCHTLDKSIFSIRYFFFQTAMADMADIAYLQNLLQELEESRRQDVLQRQYTRPTQYKLDLNEEHWKGKGTPLPSCEN